jgi:predicted enzyme related to lactoylglutathione lyase
MLTTDLVPGAPAWIELGTPDRARAAEFYGRVLGWEHRAGLFTCDGRTVAAHVPSGSGSWTVHFAGSPPARLTDPHGVEFGVWQGEGLDAVSTPGALTWLELHSPEPESSAAFYRSVLSWEIQAIPGAPGQFLRPAGTGPGRLFGAIVADSDACWLPYFEVADVDHAAAAAQFADEPFDLDGVGRIAVGVDPFGARFGVMRSVTP